MVNGIRLTGRSYKQSNPLVEQGQAIGKTVLLIIKRLILVCYSVGVVSRTVCVHSQTFGRKGSFFYVGSSK